MFSCLAAASAVFLGGCKAKGETLDYQQLVTDAAAEGQVVSLAMPDEWANWGATWQDLSIYYDIAHQDTDMNSAEELEQFAAGIGDIGDVGFAYGGQAEKEKITEKYKTSYWEEIPDWAKDDDGDWMVAYTGTLAFLVKNGTGDVSMSWKDLQDGAYTVGTSDVTTSSQAQYTVYAAALAFGGDAKNIQPGIDFFKTLAEQGRLTDQLHDQTTSLESDVDVNIKWDFIALSYRDAAALEDVQYGVCVPSDGSVTVGYASVINKKAEHLAAAKLAREYIFSDAGQLNLANGYATPIRAIVLPEQLEEQRINRSQYHEEMIQNGLAFTDAVGEKIAEEWSKQVLPILDAQGRAN